MAEIQVKSEMAGTVSQIVAAPGSVVARDDVLVLVESMKMEIPMLAPRAGRVVSILVAEGDLLGEGEVFAVLEV